MLPFIRLRDLFEIPGEPPKRENVVVVKAAGQKAGIVVDTLLGEFQTVIKPLGQLFRHLRGIGGSTILGSGEVALILDVPRLIDLGQAQAQLLLEGQWWRAATALTLHADAGHVLGNCLFGALFMLQTAAVFSLFGVGAGAKPP